MATAPEEEATAELKPLTPENDYNPFSDEDIQKILYEEQNNSVEEGWSFVKRNNFCEIWKKNERDKPVHLIKGYLNFPGIPCEKVVEMIFNLEVRKQWDRQFPVIDVLEERKHYRVVYWVVKMPPLIADRDIVQFIGRRDDESNKTTYILYRNATHPDRPASKSLVRAETILSGVIIRPDPEDPANSSKLSLMLQNDVKGWIPHFVVNAFAARAPLDWRDSLANYYANVYSKKDKEGEGGEGVPTQSTAEEGSGEGGEEGQGASVEGEEETQGQNGSNEGGDKGTGEEGEGSSENATKEQKDNEAQADQ